MEKTKEDSRSSKQPTIEVKAAPEEIADVDPEILAKMKARLEGVRFDNYFDARSRLLDEVAIKRERER